MGLICFNATDLDESVNMVEVKIHPLNRNMPRTNVSEMGHLSHFHYCIFSQVVSVLTELLRDNFRNAKLKLAIVPTLGEVLHYIASQVRFLYGQTQSEGSCLCTVRRNFRKTTCRKARND